MNSLESLFASWLARSVQEPAELEELVRAHPEHAEALRELHDQWLRLETLRQRFGLAGSLAERLRAVHGPEVDPKVELLSEGGGDFTENLVGRLSGRGPGSTRYRREGELGRGGMGAVLSVWDEDLRRRLAMKVMLGAGAPERAGAGSRDKRLLARLLEEAQVTAQLDHPGIVPVHELGLGADGEVFFTMKLVKGKTLTSVFDELATGESGWTQVRALGLLVKVCEAMSYAHAKGVIHRDLKPDNVMVGKFGEVYVMDWGLAKILGQADDKDVRVRAEPTVPTEDVRTDRRDRATESADSPLHTMDGDVLGTPAYMSPEQAAGQVSTMGPPSDVYALGAMLYHLLARHAPYVPPGVRRNNFEVWQRVKEGPPHPLHELAPDAPAELVAICERAMARDATERYADVGALAEDLSAYVEGRVVRAYETGPWAEARKWMKRNKALAASLATAALLLVVGLATALYLREQAQDNFVLAEERRVKAIENEKRARASEQEATQRADEVLRLSALQDYDELIARVDTLWPAHPENIAALEAWLREARALVEDLSLHRTKRDELRAGALPRSDEERETERRAHPDFARLEELPGLIASRAAELAQRREDAEAAGSDAGLAEAEQGLDALEAELDELEGRVNERRTWSFPATETGREERWWHANVTKLVESLEGLQDEATGLLSDDAEAVSAEHGWSVPRRLGFAQSLHDGMAKDSEWTERWAEARATIRDHSQYGGLDLSPQTGLVPIGPDPESGLWEFWHVMTGAEPERNAAGELVLAEETGVVLVLIPAGTFWMGASADPQTEHNYDLQKQNDEDPVHEVSLSAHFMSKYELTQGQWLRITGRNPSYFQPSTDFAKSLVHPVEQVSWNDVMRELSRMGLVLPTEAQWERACRAGTETPWHFGADREAVRGRINIADRTAAVEGGATWTAIRDWPDHEDGGIVHREVGAYPANAFGLHEVHGNVWEWCLDGYDSEYYHKSPRVDPCAPWESVDNRVGRGGGFYTSAAFARAAKRTNNQPTIADSNLGVRPARVIRK